jgi:bifunctional UDP-N-acetylglucosamine pyrophosphorylase/glucosamine-1-phosphate N-acetyltransferase
VNLLAVVLAAGQGTRMRSQLPKVLHRVCGRPMLFHAIAAARGAAPARTLVVIGHGADQVADTLEGSGVECVVQAEQLGTGHALRTALATTPEWRGDVLVLNGDAPLLRPETLQRLVEAHAEQGNGLTMLTFNPTDPSGYGRVVRDKVGKVEAVIEEKDCTARQRAIREANPGVYVFDNSVREVLAGLERSNAAGEEYLTDAVAAYHAAGRPVGAVVADDPDELEGVNTRVQLARAERLMRERIGEQAMLAGVTLLDPATTYLDADARIAADVTIHAGCHVEGATVIGAGTTLGPHTRVIDSRLGANVEVTGYSVIREATIENDVTIGPFAHLRPGARLGAGVHIGNYVEVKNSSLGPRTKAGHHAYIGDAEIGADVNIGAGTITVNFDGREKHRTVIEDGAFIGSDTALVAPVRIGRGAVTGAGSVITKDVPDDALAIARGRQANITDYARRKRSRTPEES